MSDENPQEVRQKSILELALEGASAFLGTMGKVSGSLGKVGLAATMAASQVVHMLSPLHMAIGAGMAAFGTHALVGVNSSFEQIQLKMAQTLRFIGVSSGSFESALADAATMVARIESSAARLPGEAGDYTIAMSQAGVHVNRAVGDFERSYSLIEKMTAVGISIGHSGGETAMLLEQALDAQRGLLDQGSMYAQSLMNAMRNLPEYAHITVAQFNKLKLEKRAVLMERVVAQYDDMIQAAGNTWDSISGAAASTLKTVARLSSTQMFEGIKSAVSTLTGAFQDGDGKLTHMAKTVVELGNMLGSWVGAGLERMAGAVSWIGENAVRLISSLDSNPLFAAIDAIYSGAAGIFTDTERVVGPAIAIFDGLVGMANGLASALAPVIDSFVVVVGHVWRFITGVASVTGEILQRLKPAFSKLGEAIGTIVSKIIDFLAPVVAFIGEGFLTLYEVTADWLVPAFESLAELVQWIADNFDPAEFLAAMSPGNDADLIRKGWELVRGSVSEETRENTRLMREGLADFLARITGDSPARTLGGEDGAANRTTPHHRGGGRTVQDFRYSRFEIQQKFEEGFDPDRIATAFASDIGRLGEQRLQSGFEPLFGVR